HVAVANRRHSNIFEMQHLGRPVPLSDDGFHCVARTMSGSPRNKNHARASAAPTSYARHHAGHQAGTPAFAMMWPCTASCKPWPASPPTTIHALPLYAATAAITKRDI